MNQLERIVELTGTPSREDLEVIQSSFSATMIEGCRFGHQKKLKDIFPTITNEAADLLDKLLQFNPKKRITAEEALRHPYVAQFHNPQDEPSCPRNITIPINDNTKYTIDDYRQTLYTEIVKRKKAMRKTLKEKELQRVRHSTRSRHVSNNTVENK